MNLTRFPANRPTAVRAVAGLAVAVLVMAACGSAEDDTAEATGVTDPATTEATATERTAAEPTAAEPTAAAAPVSDTTDDSTTEGPDEQSSSDEVTADTATYRIDVWADNWMAVSVDGVLIGEDSVSITTERSFNAESFTFEAAMPFTLAIEAKDFKETDSGLEYIGENNQQMGDGGLIAQVVDVATGEVVAVTDASWSALVVHRAPLNTGCEDDPDPDSTCEFEVFEVPADWTTVGFDDSGWAPATVWAAADVDPKFGYDDIAWDAAAQLVWGNDLEVDNTVLMRTVVG